MEIQDFIENFKSQFDEPGSILFTAEMKFRDIDEWSSLVALSIIAMVDAEYKVKIKGEDIRNAQTIKDLYDIVKSRFK
jgi:acyl carrier protein